MSDHPTSLDHTIERLTVDPADEGAWTELYRRLWPIVFAISYRRLRGTRLLAEDAAQEVFLRLVRARPFGQLADEGALRAYVSRTAENTANDYLRRALRAVSEVPLDDRSKPHEDVPDPTALAGADLDTRDLLQQVTRDLVPVDREILKLVMSGRSLSEVSAATGLSYANVGVRLHRLRGRLRKALLP